MKTKQTPSGTSRQQSTKSLDASQNPMSKSEKTRLAVGPGLMAAIKRHVRPSGNN